MTSPSRVTIVEAPDGASLPGAFAQAIDTLPGLLPERLPERVVIKPNLCDVMSWETGVTTDPSWLPVLADQLRKRRPDVRISVVESDAVSAYKLFRSCDETYDRLGYRETAGSAHVELINLSKQPSWEVAISEFPSALRVPDLFLEEFYYISLANVKVHPYERFTGTLKNALGLLPQSDISEYHSQLPELIFALFRLCAPDLAILDGRIGLEGKGPIIGEAKRLGKLIIGNDGLAVDGTACRLIGAAPRDVPHLRWAGRRLGYDWNRIDVVGEARPCPFQFDPERAHAAILAKFALRRAHKKLEQFTFRMTDWSLQAWRNPGGFGRRVLRRLVKGHAL